MRYLQKLDKHLKSGLFRDLPYPEKFVQAFSRIVDTQGYWCILSHTQTFFVGKILHLKCLTVFWECLCLCNRSVICTVTLCYVLPQVHSEFWNIHNSISSSILRYIQTYWTLIRHIQALLTHIQAYSEPCITLTYPQPCHILANLKLEAYSEPSETLTKHIQNPAIVKTVY